MIYEQQKQLLDHEVIQPSKSLWAPQVLCVRKKDTTLRVCVDWRKPNNWLITGSGGQGETHYFTQLDQPSAILRLTIAERDPHKTARDFNGVPYNEFNRVGCGRTDNSPAFTRVITPALGSQKPDVVSCLDDILICYERFAIDAVLIHCQDQRVVDG